jgi:UDP-N-acetylglucosamine 2-epimerase (non-hydrolysing)
MNILIPKSCRSDDPLSIPLIKAFSLEEVDWCDVYVDLLTPGNYFQTYNNLSWWNGRDINLVIVIGDRIEQMALAQWAFLHNVPICHFGAGITNTISTFDDIHRHNITLMSEIALCEDGLSCRTVRSLWLDIGKIDFGIFSESLHNNNGVIEERLEQFNIHEIGNPYLVDIDKIDNELIPNLKYDLVLYNPVTINSYENLPFIYDYLDKNRKTIVIKSNPDPKIEELPFDYENLSRPQFLGLLSACERFITNSSSEFYEAPYYLEPKQIIHVGNRNKDRSTKFENMKAYDPKDVVSIIEKWWLEKNG